MLAAALSGDMATVEELVTRGANINYTDTWGNRAIFAAAWEGAQKALELGKRTAYTAVVTRAGIRPTKIFILKFSIENHSIITGVMGLNVRYNQYKPKHSSNK